MSTAGALLNRVSRQLLSGTIEERNKLASTVTSSSTSIPMSYDLNALRVGGVFELDSELDSELELGFCSGIAVGSGIAFIIGF